MTPSEIQYSKKTFFLLYIPVVLTTIYCGIPPYVGVFLTLPYSLSLIRPYGIAASGSPFQESVRRWGNIFFMDWPLFPFSDAYWRCYNIVNERGRGTEYRVRTTPKHSFLSIGHICYLRHREERKDHYGNPD